MAFVTGLFLIDAPASALNMGEGEETKSTVKVIRSGYQEYPYVSAQAFRYWLRRTLENNFDNWKTAPIYTAGKGKKQQAYTEGDPIDYPDDDLFGYMRAQKDSEGGTRTRVSPFRTSTLVSLMPVEITDDFGVMTRHEGDPVLHGHEFYRTVLKGLFSLDLRAAGTFSYIDRTGFLNLNQALQDKAEEMSMAHLEDARSYRLPFAERVERVQTLLRAFGRVEGGANQTLHYTDVSPAFVIAAVTRGGNHPFGRIVTVDRGAPVLHRAALDQVFQGLNDDLLSGIYVGRAEGFMDSEAAVLSEYNLQALHPREALDTLADDLAMNAGWWE